MRRVIFYSAIMAAVTWHSSSATIINVPADYPTIQEGINASVGGDTVLVQPGTYNESIGFRGEGITVASIFIFSGAFSHIESTIIDGGGSGFVVNFDADWEYYRDTIIGFTIQNGELGFMCFHNTAPIISFNIIRGNSGWWGGGIYTEMTHATITHNLITANSGPRGGGICIGSLTDAEIYNNIIVGNSAEEEGGGILIEAQTSIIIENNVIFGNTAGQYGGGMYCRSSDITILNTIFWGDSAGVDGNEIYVESGSPEIAYCDIQGGWGGNMDADPLFRDHENGDFHLMSTECGDPSNSPCIDAGDPYILDSMLDCNWGLGTELSDMGAYGGQAIPTDIREEHPPSLPLVCGLLQNYPNPFNAVTVIRYSLPEDGLITVSIYNLLGQQVSSLYDGFQKAGYHQTVWDTEHEPSGVYFYRLKAGEYQESMKCLLLK